MTPFLALPTPGVFSHTQRSNDEHLADLKPIEHQLINRGERDDRLAKSRLKEQRDLLLLCDFLNRISLILMRFEFDVAHLACQVTRVSRLFPTILYYFFYYTDF